MTEDDLNELAAIGLERILSEAEPQAHRCPSCSLFCCPEDTCCYGEGCDHNDGDQRA